MPTPNEIKRKGIAFLLIITLFAGLFFSPSSSYAVTTVVTKLVSGERSFDDIAYYDVWKHISGVWQNGKQPGSPVSASFTIGVSGIINSVIPDEATNVVITVTGNFNNSYAGSFIKFAVPTGSVSGVSYNSSAKSVSYTVSTSLITNTGTNGYKITDEGNAEAVEGYRYYIPSNFTVHYSYNITTTVETGDFTPVLAVPSSAKQGESFDVTDATLFDDENEFDHSELKYSVDGGTESKVSGWDGTVLGASVSQSFADVCKVKYILKVWNTRGESKFVSKTIDIADKRKITAVADLVLPFYTYQGHTELAEDKSTFDVDGVAYSATRAYEEDIASNSFRSNSSTIRIGQLSDTKAECTFSDIGTYDVTLRVNPSTGSDVTDTESIEVRKTPYIIDTLTGFQKQNRKQILTATVATYPGKPLTDYSITLKDKKNGETVILTPGSPQQNTSTIKTRTVTMTQDIVNGFSYITVEFLTKTPSFFSTGTTPQDFYYQIDVQDSKGDNDTTSKTFAVTPDLPPTAAISLDSVFLRNEGTNTATIKAEDITVATDGDSVERKWYYGATTAPSVYTDVSTMDGYQKLSFGTDKIVGFNKVGVGKFTTKLNVKEVWTEPTLEEYVTESDHLAGTTTAFSDVQNVAPIVSLQLLNSTKQEILLLANNDTEYQTLLNNKTALQQALLASKIDGQIIIKKLIGNTPSDITGIKTKLSYQFPTTIWNNNETDRNSLISDSEKVYFSTWTMVGTTGYTAPATIHAYSPYSGKVWSYTINRHEKFSFGNDDTGKYLYLLYPDQTVMLDKRSGAVAGTIAIPLSDKVWLSDNLFFVLEGNDLYAIDQNNLKKTLIDSGVSAVSRVAGKLQYVTKTDAGVIRNTLDMLTLNITKRLLINTGDGSASSDNYRAVCIDSTGKVVLYKSVGTGTDTFSGLRVFSAENELIKEVSVAPSTYSTEEYDIVGIYAPLDESGKCNHVVIREIYEDSDPYRHVFTAVDLNMGRTSKWSVNSDAFINIPVNAAFEVGGKSYLYCKGWFLNEGADYCGYGCLFTFDGTTLIYKSPGEGMIGYYDEKISASDRIMASFFGDNTTGILKMQVSAFPKTLLQETAEIIAKFTDKRSFVGNKNTTAEQIKAAAEAPRPTIKVTASQNGYLAMLNKALEPNKKYYYEYEIKPLVNGTEDELTGLTAMHDVVTSGESFLSDTYFVEKTYLEDFNDKSINSFFTRTGGAYAEGKFGAYADTNTTSGKLTFNVPAGKKAILSFDYVFQYNPTYFRAGIYIDDERFYKDLNTVRYADVTGHYTHYKVLSEGTHSIECKMVYGNTQPDWERVLMDNLKVDILSTTERSLKTTSSVGKNNGWLTMSGSFETPQSLISYGAQASSYWSGAIGVTVDNSAGGRPYYRTYTISVPAGYYIRGFAYPTGITNSNNPYNVTVGNNIYERMYASSSSLRPTTLQPGEKVAISTLEAGNHIQKIQWSNTRMGGTIPKFDLITYPVNSATATGDIAFNDNFTRCFIPKKTWDNTSDLRVYLPKGEYLIKNFKFYYIENGQKVYYQNEDCEEVTDLSKWSLSAGLSAATVTPTEKKTDDEYVKIYKKGERVLYNIFYDDYEDDPSKIGYWVYSHINWPPDGVHPDVGKVLTAPIDRFYLSGKYNVTHWEADNTQRQGTVGDASPYDKESNKVTMTFYVNGDGKAPWITYIKTNPSKVKENDTYTLSVGVDDTEKDTLKLETEVFFNGKSIYADTKTGIAADPAGYYPEQTIAGLPTARPGVYQVVCTVSDYSGTGIKAYKFTVVSEGRVIGFVNHTEQWDENRKKYNLKRFSEEVNRTLQLNDYMAMPAPRMRGVNVFWSGEKFMLRAETEGEPTSVSVEIFSSNASGLIGTGYTTELSDADRKTTSGAEIWEGSLWNSAMINKWGRKAPEKLTFRFTACYPGNVTKTHSTAVIMDSDRDYWQLHRLW